MKKSTFLFVLLSCLSLVAVAKDKDNDDHDNNVSVGIHLGNGKHKKPAATPKPVGDNNGHHDDDNHGNDGHPQATPTPCPVVTPAPVVTPTPITTPTPVATSAPIAVPADYDVQKLNLLVDGDTVNLLPPTVEQVCAKLNWYFNGVNCYNPVTGNPITLVNNFPNGIVTNSVTLGEFVITVVNKPGKPAKLVAKNGYGYGKTKILMKGLKKKVVKK